MAGSSWFTPHTAGLPATAARVGLGPTGDDHRHPDGLDYREADRTQQHPGVPAAVAADDDQLRGLGLLDQLMRRPIEYDDAAHLDVARKDARQLRPGEWCTGPLGGPACRSRVEDGHRVILRTTGRASIRSWR